MRNQTMARLLVALVVVMLVMSFMIGAFPLPR